MTRRYKDREVREMRNELARRFPLCFTPKGANTKWPLSAGIREAVINACPDLDRGLVEQTLSDYTSSRKYQVALVAGSDRFTLDGSPVGTVTPTQARRAKRAIQAMDQRTAAARQDRPEDVQPEEVAQLPARLAA
jgi:sRNA-binding protein